MKFSYITILICIICKICGSAIYAQPLYFNNLYNVPKNYWENGSNVIETENEGYIFTGQTTPFSSIKQSLLFVKTDLSGNIIWVKTYGDSGEYYNDGIGGSLIKTSDGNYAFGGNYDLGTAGWSDALLVKFDKTGDTLWTKRYGNINDNEAAYRCRQTKDGGYVLIGFNEHIASGNANVYLVKADSSGNLQWQKEYGGGLMDIGFSVEQTKDGGYIIGGFTNQFNEDRFYIIKTDAQGNKIWEKKINPNSAFGCFVFQSKDSNYIVYSSKDDLTGNQGDGYIAKLDSNGNNLIWEKTIGGNADEWFVQLIELEDSSFVGIGEYYLNSDNYFGWLVKMDKKGNKSWTRTYYTGKEDSSNYCYGMIAARDGGYVIAGTAWDSTQDMWMLKVDSCGWSVGNSQPEAIFIVDSINTTNFTVFLQNTSKNACRYKWFFGDGDSAVTINTSYSFADTGMKIITLIAYAGNESDTLRDTILISLPEECSESTVEVYPNPFRNTTLISYVLTNEAYITIELYSLLGKKVFTMINGIQDIGCYKYDLNPAEIGLLPGIYLLKYSANEKAEIRKLIILRKE